MSYEGYVQYFCTNGHVNNRGCYDDDSDLTEKGCTRCGAPIIFQNSVDTTNGSWDGNGNRIDGAIELPVLKTEDFECKCCNGTGVQKVEVHDLGLLHYIALKDREEN